jgi:hypothetical protein
MTSLLVDIFYYLVHYPYFLLLIPVAIWVCSSLRTDRQTRRLLIPAAVIAALMSLVMLAAAFPGVTRNDWCANRLAPAISWMLGDRLYYPRGQGPILTRIYGPFAAMVYTPAAAAATPTGAVLIGSAIDFLLFMIPAVWLIRRSEDRRLLALASIALFAIAVARNYSMLFVARMVTTDAPAMGFAACACAAAIGADESRPTRSGLVCGLCVALAVWSKQTLAGVGPAILLYMALGRELRWTIRFAIAMCSIIAVVSAAVLVAFGPDAILFNMITLPSHRPWQRPWLSGATPVVRAGYWIWRDMMPIGWMLVAAVLLAVAPAAVRCTGMRRWTSRNPWLLPLLVALLSLPLCAYSYAQVGGQDNSGTPVSYFALLSAVIAMANASDDANPDSLSLRARIARFCFCGFLLGYCVAFPGDWRNVPSQLAIWKSLWNNNQELALRYARAHPSSVYFPVHPLAAMYAEGRTYHFNDGVYCLDLAGFPPDDAQLRDGLPKNLREIAIPNEKIIVMPELLRGFDLRSSSPDLPGWVILQRPTQERSLESPEGSPGNIPAR